MRTTKLMAFSALALLMLGACGSSGDLGDILGGGGQSATNELRGTVDYVDVNNRFVVLRNVTGYGNMLSNTGSGDTVRVYYDNQTSVEFQGQTYNVADLERGDEVAVRVDQSGNTLTARSVSVLRDATTGTGSTTYPGSGSSTSIRGTVRYVDASRRTIEIDRSGYGVQTFEYDTNTYVTYSGRNYYPQDLERGDEVEIFLRDIGGGRFLANNITVLRSVSGTGGGTSGTSSATIRGTVRYVDASRQEIGLEQTSWITRFNTGSSTGSLNVVRYDSNTNVEFNGQMYSPTNLERGDIIDIDVQNAGSSVFLANRITVVRDVNRR
jgi:hypothetical protein